MVMFATLVCSILIIVLLTVIIVQSVTIYRKYKIVKRERELIKEGNQPFGSGLSHGMVVNDTKDGVIEDSTKSAVWYSRLL